MRHEVAVVLFLEGDGGDFFTGVEGDDEGVILCIFLDSGDAFSEVFDLKFVDVVFHVLDSNFSFFGFGDVEIDVFVFEFFVCVDDVLEVVVVFFEFELSIFDEGDFFVDRVEA